MKKKQQKMKKKHNNPPPKWKKKKKEKRERGREVLHTISENTRNKVGKPQIMVAHARTQGSPLRGHVTNVTTGEKARLRWRLHNFLLGMGAPKGTPLGSRDLRSLPTWLPVPVTSGYFRSMPLPVTSLPIAPRRSFANVALSVPIYY